VTSEAQRVMEVDVAPVWKRALAWVYDALIITALLLVATLVAAMLSGGESPAWLTRALITLFTVGYFWASWVGGGKTAGMRAWRLRVVTTLGQPLTHGQALTRMLVCVATLAPILIPMVSAWFLRGKQTIYDRLSDTMVVAEPKPERS